MMMRDHEQDNRGQCGRPSYAEQCDCGRLRSSALRLQIRIKWQLVLISLGLLLSVLPAGDSDTDAAG
jgi:hypothetical protein